jgi:hypothetical protein
MATDYIVCVRKTKDDASNDWQAEPGSATFIAIDSGAPTFLPSDHIGPALWVDQVLKAAEDPADIDPATNAPRANILVYVHGYNCGIPDVLWRHRRLRDDLEAAGFKGAIVSFDWPCDDKAFNYLEDRVDAKLTAIALVDDCISLLAAKQSTGCTAAVHVLAHSTGAFVVREAFDDADDRPSLVSRAWSASQVAFIAADISSSSMSAGDSKSQSLFRHSVRITNYSNPYDSVLKLSGVKRVGTSPRLGRIGLPDGHSPVVYNVNCGYYFQKLDERAAKANGDFIGSFSHSWHIGNPVFAQDLALTLKGDIDREWLPTRDFNDDDGLILKSP